MSADRLYKQAIEALRFLLIAPPAGGKARGRGGLGRKAKRLRSTPLESGEQLGSTSCPSTRVYLPNNSGGVPCCWYQNMTLRNRSRPVARDRPRSTDAKCYKRSQIGLARLNAGNIAKFPYLAAESSITAQRPSCSRETKLLRRAHSVAIRA